MFKKIVQKPKGMWVFSEEREKIEFKKIPIVCKDLFLKHGTNDFELYIKI